MSTIHERLRELRVQMGKTQYEVADAIGISRPRYAHFEQGRAEPDIETLKALARYFGVSLEYLLNGEEKKAAEDILSGVETEPARLIPVVGVIRGGDPIYAQEDILGYLHAPTSAIKNGYNYFYLRVIGDSMKGDGIFPGSYVLVRKQEYVEDGDIAVVYIRETEEATVKRIRFIDRRVLLVPSNPEYEIQMYKPEEVKVIGKVTMVIHSPGLERAERMEEPPAHDDEMMYNHLISLYHRTKNLKEEDRKRVRSLIQNIIDFVERMTDAKGEGR